MSVSLRFTSRVSLRHHLYLVTRQYNRVVGPSNVHYLSDVDEIVGGGDVHARTIRVRAR